MSEHNKRFEDSWYGKIASLWPVIMAILAIVVYAVTVKDKVDQHEVRISKIETVLEKMDTKVDRLVDELLDKK